MKAKTFGALALATKKLETLDKTFTKKEYDAIAKKTGASSLNWLRDEGIVKVAREEKFEIEIPFPAWREPEKTTIYETENHAITLSQRDYENTPTTVLNYLVKENGAFLPKYRVKNTETITCVRYYYTFDPQRLEVVVDRGRERLLEKAEETIYECQEKMRKAQAIIDAFGDEE